MPRMMSVMPRTMRKWTLLPITLAGLLCLPAVPLPARADAVPPSAAPPSDVPIPAAELEGIKLVRRSSSHDGESVFFEATVRNMSRYRITSLELEGQEWVGNQVTSRLFTLTKDGVTQDPLQIAPLTRPRIRSQSLVFPAGTYEGYFLVLKGAHGVPTPLDTHLSAQDQLLDAAELGDMATLQLLLGAHPEMTNAPAPAVGLPGQAGAPAALALRERQRQGATPLHMAALGDHLAAVGLLLAKGAQVNARDAKDRTPLYEAVIAADVPIVTLLLAHHADPNLPSRTGSPLGVVQKMLPFDSNGGPYQQIGRMLEQAGARAVPGAVR